MTLFTKCHPSRAGRSTTLPQRTVQRFGWKPDTPDHRDYTFDGPGPLRRLLLPGTVDMRTSEAQYQPPIWDQGALGSCVAHGTGYLYERMQRKQGLTDYQPSRLFIYYNGRVIENDVSQDNGLEIRDAMTVLVKQGAPHESLWPYNIGAFAQKPPAAAYQDALLHQCIQYRRVAVSESAVRYALSKALPVVFGFTVYESFDTDATARDGVIPIPSNSEGVLGGHCMAYVGYEKLPVSGKLYGIARNSWGADWGDHGYCYLPLHWFCNTNVADDFWVIQSVEA